jgi:hypothetical protein
MARIKYLSTLIIMAIFPFVDVKSTGAASAEERLDQVNRMAEKSRKRRARRASWFGTR